MASETYKFLKSIVNGEEVSRWDYPDPLIDYVKISEPRTSTKITIAFDNDDDFLEVMGIEDENDRWAWNRYKSSYDYDFDTYRYQEDWDEGYLIRNFDQSNIDLVNQILKYTKPGLIYSDENEESRREVSKFLSSMFSDECDEIAYEYGVLDWDCILRSVNQVLEEETSNPFIKLGIIQKIHGYKFESTVGVLLSVYRLLKAEDDDLKELLKKVDEKVNPNKNRGDWYELEYNTYCDDFDNETFQYEVGRILTRMLEKAEEDLVGNTNFEEFNNLYDKVISLGGFNKHIPLEHKEMSVIFEKINPETNKLIFKVYKDKGGFERRSVDNLEDLNLQLHHPELFESIKNIIKKLL